ncbi:tRNA dihydrouridine(16) synthase DusC [Sneathiella sp. P13V-1]|uniref:tRNA dihydrouridine synthase n=1 Tax=Sneathiella sp. P13V-1 TaxID=2697366 RepID=UPI00187B823D|nr:tRNA-dihydrouridine synthase family protein [Sneathiella sp. P13V-1]MBE7636004.1 tRNA dihydrouridine(16) synthase DusC [Sneathiella sp. P13V-1]
MTVTLAPMEGVVDQHMRDILTRIGGIDLCVSEFIRVSGGLYPRRVFLDICPELDNEGKTAAGTPVHVQLMGGDVSLLAESAEKVAGYGAPGIDLNFGCPAKTVNRHDAGATLLQWPDRLHDITSAVRRAVPDHIPVSAKMRLGFEDKSLYLENAKAIEEAGASKLTIHARTKMEGYKPPAHWEYLVPIKEQLGITVVANGEIWTKEDFEACRDVCGYEHYMLGRGLIARPSLALEVKGDASDMFEASKILDLIIDYNQLLKSIDHPTRRAGRLKQWIKLLGRTYEDCRVIFDKIRRLKTSEEIISYVHIYKTNLVNQ